MQIAHIINQLVEKSGEITALLKANGKLTIKHLWKQLLSRLTLCEMDTAAFTLTGREQIRLAG
jgi:hypothetical protein